MIKKRATKDGRMIEQKGGGCELGITRTHGRSYHNT